MFWFAIISAICRQATRYHHFYDAKVPNVVCVVISNDNNSVIIFCGSSMFQILKEKNNFLGNYDSVGSIFLESRLYQQRNHTPSTNIKIFIMLRHY